MSKLTAYFLLVTCNLLLATSPAFSSTHNFSRAIDSSTQVTDQSRIHYAYGPTLFFDDNRYHMIYCSNGHPDGYPKSWDYLRYTSSFDAKTWSAPNIILKGQATNNKQDLAACLGSIVYYQDYYYLFYESAQRIPSTAIDPQNPTHGTQTVIQVARAQSPEGPYSIFTQRNSWEVEPLDPKPVIIPLNPTKGGPTHLGAGKPSVVVQQDTLHLWYTDDTVHPHGLYYLQSTSPTAWNPKESAITNSYDSNSQTIKYNPTQNKFLMLYIDDYLKKYPSLLAKNSTDGKNWSFPTNVISAPFLPFYSHSPGLVSDKYGHLIDGRQALGFGACPDLFPPSYCNAIDLYDLYTKDLPTNLFELVDNAQDSPTIIKNGSFETGILSSWQTNSTNSQFQAEINTTPQDGSYAVTLQSGSGIFFQDISGLKKDHEYELSVFAKANGGNTSTLHFWLYNLDNNTTLHESAKLTPQESWQALTTTFTPPASGTLRLHLSYLHKDSSITVDNLQIQEIASNSLPGDLNGDNKVDIFDYQKLISNFGNPYTIFDYQKIISNFGK